MSGVLHPVGPEPEETYWLRRAIVFGAVLLLVILVVASLVNTGGSGSAVAAPPTPSPGQPAESSTPTPLPASASPTPSDSASASPSTGASASADASARQSSPEPSSKATSEPTTKAEPKKAEPKKAEPKKARATGPTACAAGKLRTTLTGDQRLKPEQKTTFALSLINGSGATCVVKVTPSNFALTIYSGSDRIWSSDDCATAVKPVTRKVAAEDAVAWTMGWNGRRSADGCKTRPEVPRAGTYVATARLKGADPVQLRLILRG